MTEWVVLAAAVLAAAVLVIVIRDERRFVIREYDFFDGKLCRDATIVLLADLHNKEYGDGNHILLRAIERISPDCVLVAGDMITAAKRSDLRPAVDLLTALAEKYPVYYGNGNHEYRLELYPEQYANLGGEYDEALAVLPVERLMNRHVYLPELNMEIYGLNMDRLYYKRLKSTRMTTGYLNETLGKPDRDRVNVLIAHNPEYFREYAAWGADLVVSGHVHGGIARLPLLGGVLSPKFRLFPEFDGGLFREQKAAMVLSRGLGTHTLPIRFCNPGELVVIHLRH